MVEFAFICPFSRLVRYTAMVFLMCSLRTFDSVDLIFVLLYYIFYGSMLVEKNFSFVC